MLLIFVFDDSCVSSTPNTTRVRTRETWTSECVCVPDIQRERERGTKGKEKGRKNETVWEHATISCSSVKQWKRDREREKWESTRDNREPPRGPRVLKCRALLCISRKICSYVRANCAKGSAFLPSSLYLCLLLHSSFFYAARSFLILPFSPFVSFQLVRFSIFAIAVPSVQLPLAFSRC